MPRELAQSSMPDISEPDPGLPIKVAAEAVEPIPSSAYPLPARRPANSRLSTEKLRQNFGLNLPDWQVGVARVMDELVARTLKERGAVPAPAKK